MARISIYQLDTVITAQDKVIGTDSAGSVTKNFPLSGISELFSQGLISVGGQTGYKFSDIIEEKSFSGPNNGDSISSISTLKFSEVDAADHNIQNFILEYNLKRIIIFENNDPDTYGIFDVTSITEDSENLNYYDFNLTFISGRGILTVDKFYTISLFAGEKDKHYTHSQNNASATWNVEHNLNKRPSVSITVSGGRQGFADVVYVDNNNLTLNFSSAKSGYAYLN